MRLSKSVDYRVMFHSQGKFYHHICVRRQSQASFLVLDTSGTTPRKFRVNPVIIGPGSPGNFDSSEVITFEWNVSKTGWNETRISKDNVAGPEPWVTDIILSRKPNPPADYCQK